VRDERAGELLLDEEQKQLVVQGAPGDLVECTEGLVEEKQPGSR
jgi:hypothetical protein